MPAWFDIDRCAPLSVMASTPNLGRLSATNVPPGQGEDIYRKIDQEVEIAARGRLAVRRPADNTTSRQMTRVIVCPRVRQRSD
jgi:hypothetical protein